MALYTGVHGDYPICAYKCPVLAKKIHTKISGSGTRHACYVMNWWRSLTAEVSSAEYVGRCTMVSISSRLASDLVRYPTVHSVDSRRYHICGLTRQSFFCVRLQDQSDQGQLQQKERNNLKQQDILNLFSRNMLFVLFCDGWKSQH